jgi:hypothetical protein
MARNKKTAKKKSRKKQAKAAKRRPPARKLVRAKTPKRKMPRRNGELDEGLRETFPGSDPLAMTDPTRSIKE